MSGLADRVAAENHVNPPRRMRDIDPDRRFNSRSTAKPMIVIMSIASLAFGIWIGHAGGSRTASENPPVKTVVIVKPSQVVSQHPVPFVPSSCIDAAAIQERMLPLLNRILAEPNLQSDIITQIKSALVTKDPTVLSSAATQENTEHNDMSDVEQQLMDYWSAYQADQAQCIKEVGK